MTDKISALQEGHYVPKPRPIANIENEAKRKEIEELFATAVEGKDTNVPNNNLTRERIERAKERAEDQVELYRRALIDHKQKRDRPWAMWLEGEYEADLKYIERRIENYETYLALANAELERQSVADEEVAEAISWLSEYLEMPNRDSWIRNTAANKGLQDAAKVALTALQAYRTVTVTCENTDDCPMAICSGCGATLASYSWYDALVAGPENYCQYCGGKIVEEVRE